VENGRQVWAGQGTGDADRSGAWSSTLQLVSYLSSRGVPTARTYVRLWVFKGSGTYWEVMYAADAAVPQHENDAQAFFNAILRSTRLDPPGSETPQQPSGGAITWQNPVSGQSVQLDARWRINPYRSLDKLYPWRFENMPCPVPGRPESCTLVEEVGIRYYPDASPESLSSYAQALYAAHDPIYPLVGASRESVESGRRVWEGHGTGNAGLGGPSTSQFLRFWLFRGNGGFWRIIYSAEPWFPQDGKDAENFFKAVLSTTTP
jgi:hypothetical protein